MAGNESTEGTAFGKRWMIAAGALLVVLALIAFVVFSPGRGADENKASDQPSPSSAPSTGVEAPSAAPTQETTAAGACEAPKGKEEGLPSKAPKVSWERHPAGPVLAVSENFGPTQRDGDYWRCSARTATGALVAGLPVAYNFVSGDKESGKDGPNRDAFFQDNQLESTASFGTVEGYRIVMANANEAVIEYLISSNGAQGVMRVSLSWDKERSDWLLNTDANDLSMYQVDNPTGFTSWR